MGLYGSFRKLRYLLLGLMIRILLFRVQRKGPLFSETPIYCEVYMWAGLSLALRAWDSSVRSKFFEFEGIWLGIQERPSTLNRRRVGVCTQIHALPYGL